MTARPGIASAWYAVAELMQGFPQTRFATLVDDARNLAAIARVAADLGTVFATSSSAALLCCSIAATRASPLAANAVDSSSGGSQP